MATFVLETGTEELPSRFLAGEEAYLSQSFDTALKENFLEHGSIRVYTTPRRAAVIIDNLSPVQPTREEEVSGPPARIAWKDGVPSKALEGFARTNGVEVKDVYTIKTPKGEYVAVKKTVGGRGAGDILADVCPGIISGVRSVCAGGRAPSPMPVPCTGFWRCSMTASCPSKSGL